MGTILLFRLNLWHSRQVYAVGGLLQASRALQRDENNSKGRKAGRSGCNFTIKWIYKVIKAIAKSQMVKYNKVK